MTQLTAIIGTARRLAMLVDQEVDRTRQPVPMTTIRALARIVTTRYDEHHYLEYSQWWSKMTFTDGSCIVWGDDEENE